MDYKERIVEGLRHITGPTGGLAYHVSALAHRKTRWTPFLENVSGWINSWAPAERNLLVFGPSAGWTLPLDFLERFDLVTAVEPDPTARWLLRRRFPNVRKWEWLTRPDLLPWLSAREGVFAEILKDRPDHAVLFSNLLGQVPLLLPRALDSRESEAKRTEFEQALKGRNWASYHDVISSSMAPKNTHPFTKPSGVTLEEIAQEAFDSGDEVLDHDMLWISKGRTTELAHWHLRPNRHHLIGFVRG